MRKFKFINLKLLWESLKNVFNVKSKKVYSLLAAFGVLITLLSFWDINFITIYNKTSGAIKRIYLKNNLRFSKNERGIIICSFDGEEAENRRISSEYYSILSSRVSELNLQSVRVKKCPNTSGINIDSFDAAHELADYTNAKIVIWGSVNKIGVYPNISIKSELSDQSFTDIPILKESLKDIEINKPKDIRFFEITDEPISIISFTIGYEYYEKGDFEQARNYFYKALPVTKTPYINTEKTFLYQALSEMYLKNFRAASQIIKKIQITKMTYI